MASARNRAPPALEPFLRSPPESSLILITGTLACSPTWLATRFASTLQDGSEKDSATLIVSWSRDWNSWRNETRRTSGIDLTKYISSGQCIYLDLLSGLASIASPSDKILMNLETQLASAIARLSNNNSRTVHLVLDAPDILLALGLTSAQELNNVLLRLRSTVHSTIVTCSADTPFVAASGTQSEARPTPIEVEIAAFLVQQAHQARFVASTRELDTGAARDVSGVLRVTRGGSSYEIDGDIKGDKIEEMEALYLVQRDGNVKVFERGNAG